MQIKLILSLILTGALTTQAALYTSSPNAVIPDNNPNGYVNTIGVSGEGAVLQSVNVLLNVSGGYNGDLYAYLTYNGTTVTLLNRVGTGGGNTFGYADTGFNVALSDSGTADFHNYQSHSPTYNGSGQLLGTWQPDSGGTTFGSAYQNMNPNGTWAIFFADLSADDQGTLVSWSLDITAVPEPVNVALALFGAIWVGIVSIRYACRKRSVTEVSYP